VTEKSLPQGPGFDGEELVSITQHDSLRTISIDRPDNSQLAAHTPSRGNVAPASLLPSPRWYPGAEADQGRGRCAAGRVLQGDEGRRRPAQAGRPAGGGFGGHIRGTRPDYLLWRRVSCRGKFPCTHPCTHAASISGLYGTPDSRNHAVPAQPCAWEWACPKKSLGPLEHQIADRRPSS